MTFLNIRTRFAEVDDFGYIDEHKKLSAYLYDLVSEREFGRFAHYQGVTNWHSLAVQACDEYARKLLLVSETSPLKSDAKRDVMANFQRFIGVPAKAYAGRAAAV